MSVLEVIGVVIIVPVVDWIAITGSAARASDFDYRYWPPSKTRIVSISFLAITIGVLGIFGNPDNPPLWLLIPVSLALIAWFIIGYCDILAQRRTGYRIPPGYGEQES